MLRSAGEGRRTTRPVSLAKSWNSQRPCVVNWALRSVLRGAASVPCAPHRRGRNPGVPCWSASASSLSPLTDVAWPWATTPPRRRSSAWSPRRRQACRLRARRRRSSASKSPRRRQACRRRARPRRSRRRQSRAAHPAYLRSPRGQTGTRETHLGRSPCPPASTPPLAPPLLPHTPRLRAATRRRAAPRAPGPSAVATPRARRPWASLDRRRSRRPTSKRPRRFPEAP
mmetsp:Transcript_45304/g.145223  ORF Transcript_45304/g.145223 Transcript_45304/m.145223 type:complete len:228 (+) Transcript_45304:1066-1749(+)